MDLQIAQDTPKDIAEQARRRAEDEANTVASAERSAVLTARIAGDEDRASARQPAPIDPVYAAQLAEEETVRTAEDRAELADTDGDTEMIDTDG